MGSSALRTVPLNLKKASLLPLLPLPQKEQTHFWVEVRKQLARGLRRFAGPWPKFNQGK